MTAQPAHTGIVVHWAARYDLLVWLLTGGRERKLRELLLRPARLAPGERVLDVGSGTGTLAIAAARLVGPSGSAAGVEPSAAMVARARHKARKAGVDVTFTEGFAQSLPFADGAFDVVLSTVMLHHVPRDIRPRAVSEMARVLKPGGRLLVADFGGATRGGGLVAFLHRNAHANPRALETLVSDAGLDVAESGAIGAWGLQFVLGVRAARRA